MTEAAPFAQSSTTLELGQWLVQRADEVVGVLLDRACVRRDAADVAADRPLPRLADVRLDLALEGVVELHASAGQELDAVVGHGVVGGTDHHAHVGAEGVGQVGDAGGRQHPEADDVDTGRRQPGDDRVLEELPRDARVPTDHGHRALPAELPWATSTRAAATPRSTASSAVITRFASPRTPSVPKIRWVIARSSQGRRVSRSRRSALAELRSLAGLLQTGLLALDDARVAGQQAGLL